MIYWSIGIRLDGIVKNTRIRLDGILEYWDQVRWYTGVYKDQVR